MTVSTAVNVPLMMEKEKVTVVAGAVPFTLRVTGGAAEKLKWTTDNPKVLQASGPAVVPINAGWATLTVQDPSDADRSDDCLVEVIGKQDVNFLASPKLPAASSYAYSFYAGIPLVEKYIANRITVFNSAGYILPVNVSTSGMEAKQLNVAPPAYGYDPGSTTRIIFNTFGLSFDPGQVAKRLWVHDFVTEKKPVSIDASTANDLIKTGEVMVLDVRTAEEFATGHIPGAINIPHDQIAARTAEVPRDKLVLVICKSGKRSMLASTELVEKQGYTMTRNVTGGMDAWPYEKTVPGKVESVDAFSAYMIMKNSNVVVLDVRTTEEFATGHIPGAINIPHDQVAAKKEKISKDKLVLVICKAGSRSMLAATELVEKLGYTQIRNVTGGMDAWPYDKIVNKK